MNGIKYKFQKNESKKYIVFDVDETLGYFSQLGAFMDAISFYNKDFSGSVFERFNEILDLYPEFIRPKMIETLKYIYKKKITGKCNGVFIYTNNQGPRLWVQHIAKYFDYKVGNNRNNDTSLFDKIIAAYMINGKVVEPGRTSQNKTYDDLLRITGISPHAEVCFVDDLNHPDMRHENVLYLNVKPYVKTLPVAEMIQRYLKSYLSNNISSRNIKDFSDAIRERMGILKNQNINQVHLNLHDSNYISLNTQLGLTSSREDMEYKASGDKLLNYIKLFLKIKQHSRRGTKIHTLNDSRTRRRHHRDVYDQYNFNSGVSLSKHTNKTIKRIKKNHKRLGSKTQKNGKFMRM